MKENKDLLNNNDVYNIEFNVHIARNDDGIYSELDNIYEHALAEFKDLLKESLIEM